MSERRVLLPVIPEPTALDFPVARVCDEIERWASSSSDPDALSEASHKLAAIDTYLDRTSMAGRARIAATMRRLEVRIGQLIGAPRPGERTDLSHASDGLKPNERHAFRQMAEHPDVVEAVISESSDERPASRRQVLATIRGSDPDDRRAADAAGRLYNALFVLPELVERALSLWEDLDEWDSENPGAWGPAIHDARASIDELARQVVAQSRQIRRVK